MNLFDFTLELNGFPIRKAKSHIQKIQAISETNYDAYIKNQKEAIVEYHFKNNAFYRNFLGNSIPKKWEDIPVLTKKDLQIPIEKRLSKGFTKSNCYINKTSGSSGHPLLFAKDKYAHALTWAENCNRFGWYGINFNSSLQARFYGITLDKKGALKERIKDWLSSRYRFPVFTLTQEKLDGFITLFRKKKFDYINGYTSAIVLFAKHLKEKNIILKHLCPSIKYCIVTSEMLYDTDKELLEKQFGIPVINEYGASELDLIAFTNSQGDFVVNSETLFVEILDENNNPVPLGEKGNIIITSFYNKAHPMIRYKVGDTGILDKKSTIKHPILQSLLGRADDLAFLPNGKTVLGHALTYITKAIIENKSEIQEFVIEQHAMQLFKILYTSKFELTQNACAQIKELMQEYLGCEITLNFERVSVLDRSRRGKLKQFISYL